MYFRSRTIVIVLEGEDPRIFLRVVADEVFKASDNGNRAFFDYDPSLVMTETLADSFIHEHNGMLYLSMDNAQGRSYKSFLEQTEKGFRWRYTDKYYERHPNDTPDNMLMRVRRRFDTGDTELPKEQPTPQLQPGEVRVLFKTTHYNKLVGVNGLGNDGNLYHTHLFGHVLDARMQTEFKYAPVIVVRSREELRAKADELGIPRDIALFVERSLTFFEMGNPNTSLPDVLPLSDLLGPRQ